MNHLSHLYPYPMLGNGEKKLIPTEILGAGGLSWHSWLNIAAVKPRQPLMRLREPLLSDLLEMLRKLIRCQFHMMTRHKKKEDKSCMEYLPTFNPQNGPVWYKSSSHHGSHLGMKIETSDDSDDSDEVDIVMSSSLSSPEATASPRPTWPSRTTSAWSARRPRTRPPSTPRSALVRDTSQNNSGGDLEKGDFKQGKMVVLMEIYGI